MNRLLLSEKFHELCDHVYYQPPESVRLQYPCIIYNRRTGETSYADNKPYRFDYCYTVTYIDPNPDSDVPLEIAKLPMCKMDNCFTSDNLNHTVFIIYYHVSPTDKEYTDIFNLEVDELDGSTTHVIVSGNTVMLEGKVICRTNYRQGLTLLFLLTNDLVPGSSKTLYCELTSSANQSIHATAELIVTSLGRVYLKIEQRDAVTFNIATFRVFYELD